MTWRVDILLSRGICKKDEKKRKRKRKEKVESKGAYGVLQEKMAGRITQSGTMMVAKPRDESPRKNACWWGKVSSSPGVPF
jgi:hypothetical protein